MTITQLLVVTGLGYDNIDDTQVHHSKCQNPTSRTPRELANYQIPDPVTAYCRSRQLSYIWSVRFGQLLLVSQVALARTYSRVSSILSWASRCISHSSHHLLLPYRSSTWSSSFGCLWIKNGLETWDQKSTRPDFLACLRNVVISGAPWH